MSFSLQWFVLSMLTGSPVGSALALLVAWFVFDRFTFGVLPDPFRFLARRRREGQLEQRMAQNPHDRRARYELAVMLLDRGAFARSVETLKPNLQHGDDDIDTVFAMGAACMGAGYFDQGESLLAHVVEKDAKFRVGEVYLVLGRGRLAKGDFAGARTALETLLNHRKGSVEGRVLLARALQGAGDDGAAALLRDQAWAEYVQAPAFQRRKERFWAWRARPSRPIGYAVIGVAVLFAFTQLAAPDLRDWAQQQAPQADTARDEDE